jgi:NhaP-type Na+/H+ or K+/H+ antiporter
LEKLFLTNVISLGKQGRNDETQAYDFVRTLADFRRFVLVCAQAESLSQPGHPLQLRRLITMDISTEWFLVVGSVFIAMAGLGSFLTRLPLTTGIVYALIGVAIGPLGIDLLSLNFFEQARFIEHITEIAVVISLFTAGLKLDLPLTDPQWRLSLSLATIAMIINIALVAVAAMFILDFSLGAAILLGAILSPTDPVLASDVQIEGSNQRDRLRFALTAEGGLNDGTAFPFVMLGLGLMGYHDLGEFGWKWFTVDLVWSIFGGCLIGYLMGLIVSRCILFLRSKHSDKESLDDFLTLGLIALSYGVAVAAHSYGFLAVFAAGIALRSISKPSINHEIAKQSDGNIDKEIKAASKLPEKVLSFNEQLERVAEVVVVIILGTLISRDTFTYAPWIFAIGLLFIFRPISTLLTIGRSKTVSSFQKKYIAWLGIRGIGSMYYLAYAVTHGLDKGVAKTIADITIGAVMLSIIVHGTSVTPLMNIYEKRLKGYRRSIKERFERRRRILHQDR